MIQVEQSRDIESPPQKVWGYLGDFANWTELTSYRSWFSRTVNTFETEPGSVPGKGIRVLMSSNKGLAQTWVIEDWEPGKRLKMTVDEKSLRMNHYHSELEIAIAPKTSLTTQVTLRYLIDFQSGPMQFLSAILPLRRTFDKTMARILERLAHALAA